MELDKKKPSENLFVVADAYGFIAAYRSVDEIKTALAPYLKLDLVYYKYKCDNLGEAVNVIVLPYKSNNAVAYADTNKEAVQSVQKKLAKIDLVHLDDVGYWEFPIGRVTEDGKKRLMIAKKLAEGLTEEDKVLLANNEKLIEQSVQFMEKDFANKQDSIDTNVIDCVAEIEEVNPIEETAATTPNLSNE